jgi:glycosyltransferase involved in cell wall biosynthesis
MDHCIQSILDGSQGAEDVEIIIVDDGSTKDDTPAKGDEWARLHPETIRCVHQENGGHGTAVLAGLEHATGTFYKVVDSDDWVDADALSRVLDVLRASEAADEHLDLLVTNYVYEHAEDNTHRVVRYRNALPVGRVFTWDDIGHFATTQFLIMHAATYRTDVLRRSELSLPKHTFYVDNVFVYQPLPNVRRLYYLDADMYRYFIGRADQSVTEENMIRRIDQQILVTKIMADAHDLDLVEQHSKKLALYMYHYLSIMLMICNIYLMMSGREENQKKRTELWKWLKENHPATFRRMRYRSSNVVFLLPGRVGRDIDLFFYKWIRKIYKFN